MEAKKDTTIDHLAQAGWSTIAIAAFLPLNDWLPFYGRLDTSQTWCFWIVVFWAIFAIVNGELSRLVDRFH